MSNYGKADSDAVKTIKSIYSALKLEVFFDDTIYSKKIEDAAVAPVHLPSSLLLLFSLKKSTCFVSRDLVQDLYHEYEELSYKETLELISQETELPQGLFKGLLSKIYKRSK